MEEFDDYFTEIRNFGPEDPNYLRTVRQRVEELEEDEAERARDVLYDILEEKSNRLKRELNEAKAPGLILFVGTGVPDGHGILLDGYPWGGVDLKTFTDRLSTYDQEVYLTHEISHAFHYAKAHRFILETTRGFYSHRSSK